MTPRLPALYLRATIALAGTAVVACAAGRAEADPQWNASLVTGVCGLGAKSSYWDDTCFYNGVRADLLFGRNRYSDVSAGPFVSVATASFDDLRTGGGATLLLPITDYLPLGLSLGAYGRHDDGWHPGASGWLFFGSRSYNFHSSYVMAGGLLLGLERDLDSQGRNAIFVGAQIDGLVLALPFIFTYEWLRGSPDDDE